MRPGVAADRVACGCYLLEDARLIGGVLADREEDRLGAMCRERGEHSRSIPWPGAIVEGQHDLALAQEVVVLEMLEAEAWAAGGVDFDHAGNAEGIRSIGTTSLRNRRGSSRRYPYRASCKRYDLVGFLRLH